MEWIKCSDELPRENAIVMTKIDDGAGQRNVAPLRLKGNLWFLTDMSMYVYYTPTHWKYSK